MRGCLKTSPSWGEVLFLCSQTLVVQRVRNLQKAQLGKSGMQNCAPTQVCYVDPALFKWRG